MTDIRHCSDLDKEIESLLADGYRVDMITPADAPREIQLSKSEDVVRLIRNRDGVEELPAKGGTPNDWVAGRAGMMYRDLIPGRFGGKLIASHIRLTEGGPVPDYVHYHKIDFQLIYCLRGRIKVVYEDQGPPFWLEPGDCILQPPEIRHRVLECEAGSEVLELSSPAEHETWVEHNMDLPTAETNPDRLFGGQRFIRTLASVANWQKTAQDQFEERDTLIRDATNGLADIRIRRFINGAAPPEITRRPGAINIGFVVASREKEVTAVSDESVEPGTEILWLELRDPEHVTSPLH